MKRHRRAIVLAPSQSAADDLVRSCCDTALLGVSRHTFRNLVYTLSSDRMNAAGLAPVSGIARDGLAAAVARKVKLTVLREASEFPGFPGALSRTLRDLRLSRITPDRLASAGRTGPDLAILLAAYEAELRERRYADIAARVELAIEEARSMEPAALLLLSVDVRSAAERELIEVLVDRAPEVMELSRSDAYKETCLGAVQQFALTGAPAPQRAKDSSFCFVSASSESLECVEIARQILHSGITFDETAVLLRNPQRHGALVREAFDRAGIPAWYAGGTQHPDLTGRAFLVLLRCRKERYSAARFAEYLSLGQVPCSRWERLLRESAVIGGAERWPSRLNALQPRSEEDAAALHELKQFVLPVIELLASFPQKALWSEWTGHLQALADLTLKSTRTVEELLDELAPLGDLGPVTIDEVIHLLERSLPNYREPGDGNRYGKVFVATIEEACGMQFRSVFLPGLNEGMFPRPHREDPLLLDDQRSALGMPQAVEESELLRMAVSCATERLSVSCSRVDLATGRARVPSFFAAEVLKSAYGASADVTRLIEDAKSVSETRIGWSAPENPADSIDDAEYDLAAYRVAVQSKNKGAFAWIGQLNAHAERAIRARILRWSEAWSAFDGLADTDVHVSSLLQQGRLTEHPYAVSGLQQFARCPYRFYLQQIARLSPVEEPRALERMDPLLRGRLYHSVLFELFESGGDLDEILQRQADALAAEHAPPVPGIWRTGVEKLRTDLRGWLAMREPEWTPLHAELAFGLSDLDAHDPSSSPDPVVLDEGHQLKGSIDLVEQHASTQMLRVIDHKTGKYPYKLKNCVVGGGETLQPVLYALAAESLLGRAPTLSVLSYSTLQGGYQSIPVRIDDDARQRASQVLATIDAWIDQAFLPAAPKPDGCSNCEYLPVCGPYEESRVLEKDAAPLKRLNDVRRLP